MSSSALAFSLPLRAGLRARYYQWQTRAFALLETGHDLPHRVVALSMTALIVLNVIVVVLETEALLHARFGVLFHWIEVVCVLVFTLEYLLRLWACRSDPLFAGTVTGRLRYARTPLALIDLLSIVPFYLPMLVPVDVALVRLLRLFRLLRVLKLAHYSAAMQRLGRGFRQKKEELLVALAVMLLLLVLTSTLMYTVEHDAQKEAFASIPAALWWGTMHLATVGYGDVTPVTPLGKFLAGLISILGVGVFALPAGILASAFAQQMHQALPSPELAGAPRRCPHCGQPLDLPLSPPA